MPSETLARRLAWAAQLATLCGVVLVFGVCLITANQGVSGFKPSAANSEKSTTKPPARDVPIEYPFGDICRWLSHVKSLHLWAECRDERSPDGIAKSLRQLKGQFPDLKDTDPLVFTELLPIQHGSVEYAFDQTRLRSLWSWRTATNRDLSRSLRIWDGKRALMHEQYFRFDQNGFRLAPKPERVVESLWQNVTYLSRQPPVSWWNNTPEAKKEFEQSRGTPADYVVVGREKYHGVECDVLLSSVGNQSDLLCRKARISRGNWDI